MTVLKIFYDFFTLKFGSLGIMVYLCLRNQIEIFNLPLYVLIIIYKPRYLSTTNYIIHKEI